MIFDNMQIIQRINNIYTKRNDKSIYKCQDDLVLMLYSIVSTNKGLYKFMGSRSNYNLQNSVKFKWLYVLQKQLEHSRNFNIQYNILEILNICLYNTSPGEISKFNKKLQEVLLPTLINQKIFSTKHFNNFDATKQNNDNNNKIQKLIKQRIITTRNYE